MGFFKRIESRSPVPSRIPGCGACGLHKSCRSPKMPPTGEGRRKILVVAEAPGATEDEQGTQLVGRTGKAFRKSLAGLGPDLNRDCWKTNAVCCRPPDNRTPTDQEVRHCRPLVLKAIREFKPSTILLLGAPAVKSVIGWLWREDVGQVGRWVGWQIPDQRINAWVCPTWHPSYLDHSGDPVVKLWFDRHLEAAVMLEGRPWDDVVDWSESIQCWDDPAGVARKLRAFVQDGGPVAIDYETNMLKPDSSQAAIYSCAVCWRGRETFAFPWVGEAVEAMGELLRSPVPKFCQNMKFEDRWTRMAFGHHIRNCRWDTMQAAHVLDNRRGITSLTFQSFVRLGQAPYDQDVSPYLKSEGGCNVPNRIGKADLGKVLRYNGMDALCCYKLAEIQMKELGE